MWFDWTLRGAYRKSGIARRNAAAKRVSGGRGRQLRLEPLEVRSLLSAVPGWPSGFGAIPPALYGAAPSMAASQLLLLTPQGAQTGVATTVELAAVSSQGNIVQGFSDNIKLTSSDGAATLPTNITFKYGIATFSVTFNTAGRQTLTATDATNTALGVTAPVNVSNPAVAAELFLAVPRSAEAGVPVTVQLAAVNSQGNIVQTFSDSIKLTSSDGAATLPTSITFKNGIATLSVTFNTAGTQTLTATDTTNKSLVATAATSVSNPAVATQLSFVLSQKVTTGVPATVQLTAVNSQGNIVQTFSDSIKLTSSDGAATLPTSITFKNGVATFSVTFNTSGKQTLTATDTTNKSLVATAATSVSGSTPTPTPNPASTTSTNWSGYAAETSTSSPQSGSVSAVSGSWTVPSVTSSSTAYCAVWVGIDGYGSSTVEQIGTESDVVDGHAEYAVWYQMYPSASVDISSMTVAAGDSITASVQYVSSGTHAGEFQLSIADTSRANDSFTTYQSASQAERSSAEWIVEAPSSNSGVLPLANFSSVAFTNASATINGVSGPIDGSKWQAIAINIAASSASTPETSTSGLTDTGTVSSFTVSYVGSSSTVSNGSQSGSSGPSSGVGGWGWDRPDQRMQVAVMDSAFDTAANGGNNDYAATDRVFESIGKQHI